MQQARARVRALATGGLATDALDDEIAFAFRPLEHGMHGGAVDVALNLEVPAQAADFRVEIGERGNAGGIHRYLQISERGQLAQDAQRIVAMTQQIRARNELDAPARRFAQAQILARRRCQSKARRPRLAGSRGARRLAHDAIELGAQRRDARAVDGFLALRGDEHAAHGVARAQQHVDDVGAHLALAGAQLVEQCFEHVREAGHFVERKRRGAALDGMRHAKDGVDELGVDFAGGKLQQRRLHRVERLETLFEEDFVELREIERHAGYSSNGLTPSRLIAFSSVAERPIHLYATPFSRQSSAKATMSCTPAVSTCSTLAPSIS